MAIVQEVNGDLVRTYSDAGMKIHGGFPEEDYDEAIDLVSLGRVYTETNIPINSDEEGEQSEDDVIAEKAAAFDILMGE